jgi:hypothetical protein
VYADIVLGNAEPLKTLLKHIRSKFDRDFLFQGSTSAIFFMLVRGKILSMPLSRAFIAVEKGTRRQKIAEELTTTERTYVTHLRTLTNVGPSLLAHSLSLSLSQIVLTATVMNRVC